MDNIAFPNALLGSQYAGVAPPNGEQSKSSSNARHPPSGSSFESLDHGFAALLEQYGGKIASTGTGHGAESEIQFGKEISTGPTSVHQILPSYLSP
jgi:hypothetical protein